MWNPLAAMKKQKKDAELEDLEPTSALADFADKVKMQGSSSDK